MSIFLLLSCQQQKKITTDVNVDRLQVALEEKAEKVTTDLLHYNLKKEDLNILIVAYKNSDELHIYGKTKAEQNYQKIKTYPICSRSGKLGPKKMEGDKQVPEGFYHIDRFNPKSLYYLSLGLNYPNELDKSLGYTGSDIFIHGKCVTVGCLPMTDDLIKEIYIYASWAKEAGQKQIPVYIFPFEMNDENIQQYKDKVDDKTVAFWKNLQEGYDLFETNKQELDVNVSDGKYTFSK